MNKIAAAGVALAVLAGSMAPQAEALTATYEIRLENPLNRNRADVPVVIDLSARCVPQAVTCAVLADGDAEIPCQLDDIDGDGLADELAFTVDIRAKAARTLRLTLSDCEPQHVYPPRVYANLMLHGRKKGESVDINSVAVPGQVNFYNMCFGHGPMFESELVGYRVYFNEKQTLDPYGKFNKGLELEESRFYPDDDMLARGFGDDVLLAGNSCGIGAFKGWDGTRATHIKPVDSREMRIVSAGPVRTVVECRVKGWDYPGGKIDMTNRYTLYAGHRDVQIDAIFAEPLSGQTFATGVERVMGDETVSWSDHRGLVASWGRHWPVNDTVKYAKEKIGIATYIPPKYIAGETTDDSNYLYTLQAPGCHRITYHTMFTSGKETYGYADSDSWFAFMPLWRQELENPVKVTLTPLSR